MTLTYRTTGSWGAGKGSNLTASEIDNNFWELVSRIVTLEGAPLDPVSITDITVAGTNLTIHLTDGTTRGPFALPTSTLVWQGEWTALTAYTAFNVVYVTDVGAFLVLQDHTSAATFDAAASNTAGDYYHQLFGALPTGIREVKDVTGDYAMLAADADFFVRVDTQTGGATITIDDVLSGVEEVMFRQSGAGNMTLAAATGVTILPITGKELYTEFEGAVMYVKRTAVGEYTIWGDFAETALPQIVGVGVGTDDEVALTIQPPAQDQVVTVGVGTDDEVAQTINPTVASPPPTTPDGDPIGVALVISARGTATAGPILRGRVRSGTTEADAIGDIQLTAAYSTQYAYVDDDPDSTEWASYTEILASEFGYTINTTNSDTAHVSRFGATVILTNIPTADLP